ncbi:MAG: hypothetical protein ACXAES_19090 [Promethearchaeota archaeon]|jgi:hypothetical protein
MLSLESVVPGKNSLLYCPTPKQFEFHAGRGVYYERAVLCGGGAGKTICGLFEDIRWTLDFPGSVGIITEPSYPMIRLNIIPALESKYLLGCPFPFTTHPYVAKFSRLRMRLDWVNGSQWWFRTWDNPESIEGANIDYIHLDEARLILHLDRALLTAKRRLRGSGRCRFPLKPSMWITTTTDRLGSVLFNELENPKTRNPDSKIYRWSIFDNPFLPKAFLDAMVQSHKGGFAERFIYGRFANIGEGSFEFDTSVHVKECTNIESLRIRYGVDFGWTNPSAIMVDGFDGDGRLWVLDEFYKSHSSAEDLIIALDGFRKIYGAGPVLCDKSEPESIAKFRRGLAEKGISGFAAEPYTHKREDGLRDLGSRFAKGGDDRPRFYVYRCVNAISELLEYDIEVKEHDHAVDAIRYGIPLQVAAPLGAFRFG